MAKKTARRRATTSKATRKATTQKPFYVKVQHNDAEVAKHWDYRKTRNQNMAVLGLACDVNEAIATKPRGDGFLDEEKDAAEAAAKKPLKLEMFDIPQSDDLSRIGRNERRHPMSEDKQAYIVRLLAKHGSDPEKMACDHKLNPMQFTPQVLRKAAARYHLLTPQQILV
eukprot:CAMPEP_0206823722 /NCGR_PEP_ID=MMETSP0975-20121206/13468_1 /ASSEMBLY_ACC=CAM_ASM_000399 /TAXON_ID=483370 /ORGANISM="non described non described, Strain CCMP2097" /LENGTH=168 /DNA_ID=CAMNT_0054365981 /DNA_START=46 /DNA_END=549 /DNA_ORIENTATION=-